MEANLKDVNELIKRRYEELNELSEKGFQPYAYSFDVDSDSEDIKENYKEDERFVLNNGELFILGISISYILLAIITGIKI